MNRLFFISAVACCLLAAGCIGSTVRFATPERQAGRHQRGGDGSGAVLPDSGRERPDAVGDAPRLLTIIRSYIGTPYRYGGMSRGGIDCSGLVFLVYREFANEKLPHSSRKLRTMGRTVRLAEARCGDVLFFRMGFLGFVDHVGLYTDNGSFVHASSKLGVVESSMGDDLYRTHFIEARRLFP